jgi:uncharacterized protein (TIGR01319 family)
MAAAGLVADLTARAARQAALNAGARVELVLAGRLGEAERRDLERHQPEILLFAGGTDGGQRSRVLANAEALATADAVTDVVVACNAAIASRVASVFARGGRRVVVVDNVMPAVSALNIEPARAAIHRIFIDHVIRGKGLSQSAEFGSAVIMPTPEAVLVATRLLADSVAGARPVVVVDVGGATTDVHSSSTGQPAPAAAPLLPLPELVRTVQGDLGVRSGAPSTLNADRAWLEQELEPVGIEAGQVHAACARRRAEPAWVPRTPRGRALDRALGVSCVTHALQRHCGSLVVRSSGRLVSTRVDGGPDLSAAGLVIGTGGVIAESGSGLEILASALARRGERSLAPRTPALGVDRSYVLAAAGLLGGEDPGSARRLLRSEIPEVRDAA